MLTEAGFGSDMGGEKFFNIKCPPTYQPTSLVSTLLVVGKLVLQHQAGSPPSSFSAHPTRLHVMTFLPRCLGAAPLATHCLLLTSLPLVVR